MHRKLNPEMYGTEQTIRSGTDSWRAAFYAEAIKKQQEMQQMKTPTTRRPNPRASARAARLEAERARQEEAQAQAIEAAEPEPEAVLPAVVVAEQPAEPEQLQVDEGKLAHLAHVINTLVTKTDFHQRKSDDLRLATALHLADAKRECAEQKIQFKTWVTGHLTLKLSYQSALKLSVIGAAENPEEALRALRTRNAIANKEHRQHRAISAPVINLPEAPAVSREPALDGRPGEGTVTAGAHDVASEVHRNDRVENAIAFMRELRVPDLLTVIKSVLPLAPREAAIEALRETGFVVVGFGLEAAAE